MKISFLSKGLKFDPTENKINQAKLKRELEEYGRKLRLMCHFRDYERLISQEDSKLKLVPAIFHQIFIFHQMIALQKP